MNIYLVVEGEKTETLVYDKWIGYTNDSLRVVRSISDVSVNCVYMIAGNGWPSYLDIIKRAVEDVCSKTDAHGLQLFSRLVVAVDTETVTVEERTAEIDAVVAEALTGSHRTFDLHVVAQHFCIEVWFLGNRDLLRGSERRLSRQDIEHYDVSLRDPELLDVPGDFSHLTNARYAKRYLKNLVRDRYPQLTYSSRNPGPVLDKRYYKFVVSRFNDMAHIQSFEAFIKAFS